jgi:type VI secretion system secreted protein Hcp
MADFDLFLKIDGIEGECQDSKHKGDLQITSFSKGVDHAVTGGTQGDTRGQSQWQDAAFTMKMDKSYPKLFLSCTQGDHINKAVLTCRKAGREQQEFLKITFYDALVSRCEVHGGHDMPLVAFSFNFSRIEEEYKTQKDDGSLSGAIKYSYSIPTAKGQ